MKCADDIDVRDVEENFINIDPIQAAGRLTADAMKAIIAYGDGYSVCDNCLKPFRLDYIKKPPLAEFHDDLASWLEMTEARVVPGARRGFQAVAQTYVNKGDPVVLSSLGHYTEFIAVEQAGGVPFEVPKNESNIITTDAVAETIEDAAVKAGKNPVLLFMDHVDYQYGNLHDIRAIAKIAHSYDTPVLCNGAYTVGTMPVSGKELGVDFIVGSGHKSMASPAPSGLLAATTERAEEVFRTTKAKGNVSGRTFGIKEVEMMGCTLMGATVMGMMASFPHVKERVKHWDKELENAAVVLEALLSIEGTTVVSEFPRRHTLTRINTLGSFDKVAQTHKKKGFFLSKELKKRGITGVIPGSTRVWKYNTYGITATQAEHVAGAFREIAEENGLLVR